jgi:hypothetical protein
LSIFAKDCPRCGETNAAYAVSCRCGFAFNSLNVVEEEEQDVSVTIQEEELYLEYLRARAQQAAEAAKRAASAAAAQPANKAAASQSQQAQIAAEQAQTELEQQGARMKVAMNVLTDDKPARQEQPASTPPARIQPPVAPSSPTSTPPRPTTASPLGERKQPAPAAAKPTATPPLVERKEPAPAPVKSPAPAAKGGETTLSATAKTPQDLNKYIPDSDNARATSAGNSARQVTGQPVQSQTKMPMAHAGTRPETKVHPSTPAIVNKVASPTAKANVTQAVPTKAENPPANKQPVAGSIPTPARPTPPVHKNASADSQAPGAAGAPGKPTTQGDTVVTKAAAAAARAKQLAEALKAAQAERAAKMKTSAATPGPARNEDGKTRQEKPVTSAASTVSAKMAPAPAPAPNPAKPVAGATFAKPVNGQQQNLSGHDKPTADINAIHIPGTGPAGNEAESNEVGPKQAASSPATVAKQPGKADTISAGDGPTQKINGASRHIADNKETVSAKTAPGVTVTETPGANPQEELEAALKALSLRTPAPPAPEPAKAPADAGDTPVASPDLGNSAPPVAASTPPLDELPSLEPVTPANQKDCPNCTALLPMEAKRCRCGFRFPEVEETMPGLSLSDSDFAAMDGDEPSTGITHLS